jgi:DNA-binding transcriptional LysR family regulator
MTSLGGTDLNLLVALRALLEEGNVTRAGARIGMSQPAMSAALARLRRHYKDELLVRSGRDYELTPFAKTLIPSVQRTLRVVERALGTGHGFDPETSERVFRLTVTDYAITVLGEPLLRRVSSLAPGVRLELTAIPVDMHESDRGLLQCDGLIAPLGFGFAGQHKVLFRDRFVCVVDPGNPRLRDGRLSLDDLRDLPHAARSNGHTHVTPADRVLDELGVHRRVQVSAVGWLPLPFLVAGTDLVAIVPERLARRVAAAAGLAVAEPPFGEVELVEALWWHPDHAAGEDHSWLRRVLVEVAAGLGPIPTISDIDFPAPVPAA